MNKVEINVQFSEASIDDLGDFQGNLKELSIDSYEKLKNQILENGFIDPFSIWINYDNEMKLLDGHQRVRTLKTMRDEGIEIPDKFPICIINADTEKQAKKILLSLVSQYGSITKQGLYEFIETAQIHVDELSDFKLPEIDVNLEQFKLEFYTEEEKKFDGEKTGLDSIEREQMNQAWSEWCGEIVETISVLEKIKVFCQSMTPAYMKICFLNSLYLKKKFPRSATTARQYHRMFCSGDGTNGSIVEFLQKTSSNPNLTERIRFALQERPSVEKLMTVSGIPMAGHKAPLDFPAELARDLINEFSNEGYVLDPCHGWGGRLIGFLLSNAYSYNGVDASDLTNDALKQIINDLIGYTANKKAEVFCSPFEKFEVKENHYDMALTSPPYFDREHYLGGEQAHTVYKTYEEFIDGFYAKMFENVFKGLKNEGHFILQIGNQKYDLDQQAIRIAKEIGFEYVESRDTAMKGLGDSDEEEIKEILLIFKKSNRSDK